MRTSALLAGTGLIAASVVAAVQPITIKGSKFFLQDGTQFFMKGVAYQREFTGSADSDVMYNDPLADSAACRRDVPLLKELGTNTIRVYAVDPTANHDECMQLFDSAGIYVVADLSEPKLSIIRSDPKWNDDLYERYTAVIDELQKYDNVLGFFAGNEVTNNATNTGASAFVKAAVRDTKAYIKSKGYREMGVGYATNDDTEIRDALTDYFNCNSKEESVDFWGYNIYSWCGDSTYEESGFDKVVEDFSTYSVPVFFAEYGCNEVQPRKFTEVRAIYGPQMTPVLSGGIVYMFHQEANDYGLVQISGNRVTKLDDFDYLKSEISKVKPRGVNKNSYNPTAELRTCPATNNNWRASATLPPTPNKELCSCMVKSLSCVADTNIDPDEMGELFATVCGYGDSCQGISADPSTGEYGAYSMCNPTEQLSHAFNQYYLSQNSAADACDFGGAAKTQKPSKPSGTCGDLIEEAGEDGTGTVTSGPGGSGTGSPNAAATMPAFSFGLVSLGAYVLCAMAAGAGVLFM